MQGLSSQQENSLLYLLTVVLLLHGPVHELEHVLVEVVDEVRQVLLVGLRRQTLPSDPFDLVPVKGKVSRDVLNSLFGKIHFSSLFFNNLQVLVPN